MQPTTPILHPLVASSIDPTKVSATVTGILTSLSGIIMIIATVYHYPLTANQLNNFIQEFAAAASAIVTAGGMAYAIFGILRKVVAAIFKTKNNTPVTQPIV